MRLPDKAVVVQLNSSVRAITPPFGQYAAHEGKLVFSRSLISLTSRSHSRRRAPLHSLSPPRISRRNRSLSRRGLREERHRTRLLRTRQACKPGPSDTGMAWDGGGRGHQVAVGINRSLHLLYSRLRRGSAWYAFWRSRKSDGRLVKINYGWNELKLTGFVTNRRLLLSASDAFGRVMYSYKVHMEGQYPSLG